MKTFLLCAGAGTRLGQLTAETPKCLLDLHGRPLLYYLCRQLAQHGTTEFIINYTQGTTGEAIPTTMGKDFQGIPIRYSREPQRLGTAGSLRFAQALLTDENFIVHYGDILHFHNWASTLEKHRCTGATVTCVVHHRKGSNSILEITENGCVTQWLERPTPAQRQLSTSDCVSSSLFVCHQRLLPHIPVATACDLPKDIFPTLVRHHQIFADPLNGPRVAIDSPERYQQAQHLIQTTPPPTTTPATHHHAILS